MVWPRHGTLKSTNVPRWEAVHDVVPAPPSRRCHRSTWLTLSRLSRCRTAVQNIEITGIERCAATPSGLKRVAMACLWRLVLYSASSYGISNTYSGVRDTERWAKEYYRTGRSGQLPDRVRCGGPPIAGIQTRASMVALCRVWYIFFRRLSYG